MRVIMLYNLNKQGDEKENVLSDADCFGNASRS